MSTIPEDFPQYPSSTPARPERWFVEHAEDGSGPEVSAEDLLGRCPDLRSHFPDEDPETDPLPPHVRLLTPEEIAEIDWSPGYAWPLPDPQPGWRVIDRRGQE